ncbi:hypothetical protein [Actinoplanes rectilineatus]|uniref:hypothetical protein n=1 Tax=Actinoplanes rectilineatus TaxID=113571 RepID=UPI0005F29648|nr:hypothetical protein [Actinoplanes rectilineatus]
MTIRTMAHHRRAQTDHTDWCMRDHTCGLAEHRGRTITVGPDTGGRYVITRVRAGEREYAEITARVPLHPGTARQQLATIARLLGELFNAVAALRPALSRRTASTPLARPGRPALDAGRAAIERRVA